jgi:poly(hydroxyalkanoate) depolymerase family esterase
MTSFEKAISHLHDLRRRFEGLLDAARQKVSPEEAAPAPSRTELPELTDFGRNPGNLRMFAHVPEDLSSGAPLVIALHGCSQTAAEYDRGSGWSALADRLGFAVVYPEQQPANNPKNCFSWFRPGDTARDLGEARSIRQMAEHAIATFDLDRRRIFVTGLSAGGAMASTMLAAYPDVFAGGAVIAEPSNCEEIIRQWTDVHGFPATPSFEETIGRTTRRVWNDAKGDAQIEAFLVDGMAHGVPLTSTLGRNNCGAAGPFFLDAGISSTHYIADFWRLGETPAETSRAAAASAPRSSKAESRDFAGAKAARDNAGAEKNGAPAAKAAQDVHGLFDPNIAIAAAFKAAGLPVPDLPNASAATLQNVNPNPVIQAALKAAGLRRLNRR